MSPASDAAAGAAAPADGWGRARPGVPSGRKAPAARAWVAHMSTSRAQPSCISRSVASALSSLCQMVTQSCQVSAGDGTARPGGPVSRSSLWPCGRCAMPHPPHVVALPIEPNRAEVRHHTVSVCSGNAGKYDLVRCRTRVNMAALWLSRPDHWPIWAIDRIPGENN
jgi:hypothetical protein